jgi:hypothetical protein
LETGNKKGVGKNALEWLKMSMQICKAQPNKAQGNLFINTQIKIKATNQIIRLWEKWYS